MRATRAQARFLEASRKLADAMITLDHELRLFEDGIWPDGCTSPLLPEFRDHCELGRSIYTRLCERL